MACGGTGSTAQKPLRRLPGGAPGESASTTSPRGIRAALAGAVSPAKSSSTDSTAAAVDTHQPHANTALPRPDDKRGGSGKSRAATSW